MKLSEQIMFWPGPLSDRRKLSNKVAQLEDKLAIYKVLRSAHKNHRRQLKAENEALREYALGLMANSYHGMGREERRLILESELIALLTGEQGQVLEGVEDEA